MTVKANGSLLQVESAEINEVIQNQQVAGLPLKSRDFMELAILSPGVATEQRALRIYGHEAARSVHLY